MTPANHLDRLCLETLLGYVWAPVVTPGGEGVLMLVPPREAATLPPYRGKPPVRRIVPFGSPRLATDGRLRDRLNECIGELSPPQLTHLSEMLSRHNPRPETPHFYHLTVPQHVLAQFVLDAKATPLIQ